MRLIIFELRKLLAQRVTLVALALVLCAVAALTISYPLRNAGNEERLLNAGFCAMAESARFGVLFSSGFLLLLSSASVSREVSGGALKMILVRPVRRVSLLHAKLIALSLVALFFLGVVFAASHLAAGMRFGYDDVWTFYQGEAVGLQRSYEDMYSLVWLSFGLAVFPLFSLVAFGMMWSTLADNVGTALTLAVLMYAVLFGVAGLLGTVEVFRPGAGPGVAGSGVRLEELFFQHYYFFFFERLERLAAANAERWPQRESWMSPVVCAVSAAVFHGVAVLRFVRRDVL